MTLESVKSAPVSMVGRWVSLRPIGVSDYGTVYRWRVDLSSLHLWSTYRRVITLDEFEDEFEAVIKNSTYFLIERLDDGCPVGFCQTYNTNPVDGWTHILFYLDPQARRRGKALEGAYMFFDYLFSYFPFSKLYAEVFEYNGFTVGLLEDVGFQEEGRFHRHIFCDGRHWDMVKLALYREEWGNQRMRWSDILAVNHEAEELLRQ